ncbi:MAG: hypothetical protein ACLQU1_31850 [Bryobacteraceae bacterium]
MKPRFQADNDLRGSIRTGVLRREPSIDFQSARAASLDGIADPGVLRLAMAQGRSLISHDENSMPGHFRDFLDNGNQIPGVLMVPQEARVGRVIESILSIWIASEADEWIDRIVWLPL